MNSRNSNMVMNSAKALPSERSALPKKKIISKKDDLSVSEMEKPTILSMKSKKLSRPSSSRPINTFKKKENVEPLSTKKISREMINKEHASSKKNRTKFEVK